MPEGWRDYFRYLPVSPLDEQWGLYVTAIGFQAMQSGEHFVAKGHSVAHDYTWRRGRTLQEYAVVYFSRGQGEFESKETGKVPLQAGDVLFLFPGVWHRYRPDSQIGWEQYWVTFQGEYAECLRQRGFLRSEEPLFYAGVNDRIAHAFTHLLDHVRAEPLGLQQIAAADTHLILATALSAIRHQQAADQVHDAVCRAKAAIEASDGGWSAVAQIAEEVCLSRSYFHKVFKDCTGLSPYQYHLQIRINRAQELLRGSNLSAKQIAQAVQFQSEDQFGKAFKKRTGMTPGEYRRGGRDANSRRRPI